jgi:translation initiation factor 2B subunit (eIF-2B alpha/beta/delta family)
MDLKKNVISLFNDRKSGSSSLLIKLNMIIKKETGNKEYLSSIIKESRKHFNDFTIIQNYLDEIENELNNEAEFKKTIDFYNDYVNRINTKIFENGREHLINKSKILTLSNSLTIANFLIHLYGVNKKLRVNVTESRPKNEGRILAKQLIRQGIPTEFITDFNSARYIESADAVITGADKILATGNVINKTGSRALAIICKYYDKPFYVITTKGKESKDREYIPAEKDPEEVWRYADKNLKVSNYYFEEIEKDLITKIITD